MADSIISGLPLAASLSLSDLFELEQGVDPTNSSVHGTLQQLRDLIASSISLDNTRNTVTALSIVAGVVDIDLDGGRKKNFTLVLTANVASVTYSNPPAVGYVAEYDLKISQDNVGGRTFAIPASHKPLGGSDTSVPSAANAVAIFSAKSFDQATSWDYALQERGA